MNRATLLGNIGKEPEFRKTLDGLEICTFSFATHEKIKNKATGEKDSITHWHPIVIKNAILSDLIRKYASKGTKLLLEGKIITRSWKDNAGKDQYKTEIVLEGYDAKIVFLGGNQEGKEKTKDNFSDVDVSKVTPYHV